MAKSPLPREELARIVANQMPGWTLVDESEEQLDAVFAAAPAEAVSPDLATLREKYLPNAAPDADVASAVDFAAGGLDAAETAGGNPPPAGDDLGMTVVKPDPTVSHDAWSTSAGPKSLIVSTSNNRIVGSQG